MIWTNYGNWSITSLLNQEKMSQLKKKKRRKKLGLLSSKEVLNEEVDFTTETKISGMVNFKFFHFKAKLILSYIEDMRKRLHKSLTITTTRN